MPLPGDVDPHAWALPPELAAAQITAAHCQAVIPMAALGRTNGLANAPLFHSIAHSIGVDWAAAQR